MSKNTRNRLLVIAGVILVSLYFTFPLEKNINLGLDLKGGMHLVLQVDMEELKAKTMGDQDLFENAKKDVVERALEVLRLRINSMGVGETVIQKQGDNKILVQLPGITDRDEALQKIGQVAKLEFRLVNSDVKALEEALKGNVPAGYILKYIADKEREAVLIEDKAALDGERIADAYPSFDSQTFGQPYISLRLDAKGARTFGQLTRDNIGERLAIVLDGEVISAPSIRDAIMDGNAQITGQFTYEEAQNLSSNLRSALPAPLRVEEERTIGPLLGKDSIAAGINATIIGGVLLFSFMIVYYLQAGLVTDLALTMNLLLITGIMGLFNFLMPASQLTLTLPGIAGIILTLGMAVDANILINERIREETRNDRPLPAAISNGFNKALKAIVDSNTTTLIAAFMLFQFGSGPIKGFAVTLSIGLIASLFTALFVTRTIFNALIELKIVKKLPMLSFFAETRINFISMKYICFTLSIIVIIASILTIIQRKDDAYGIDFAGGQVQEYKFKEPINADDLRNTLKEIHLDDAVIQQFDQYPENVIIRTQNDTYEEVSAALKQNFSYNPFEVLRIEKVGPVVGEALRKKAVLAILFALGGILVYMGFRFKHFDFAAAGIIALLHDIFVALGILLMLGRQIDLLVVTALLTIAGYSINDTIVIYDRVRENLVKRNKLSLAEIINESVNQTLSRTILTTLATMLVVVALFLYGGEVLNSFALCLIIGFIAGTYSTVFIVSPLVLAWEGRGRKT